MRRNGSPSTTPRLRATVLLLLILSGCASAAPNTPSQPPKPKPISHAVAPRTVALPAEAAMKLGRHLVTMAALEHWTTLNVILSSQYRSGTPPPNGFLPDPPSYQKCIKFLATNTGLSSPEEKLQRPRLQRECQLQQHRQQDETLSTLIIDYWVNDEATRRGITVTDHEIKVETAKLGINLPRHPKPTSMGLSNARLLIGTHILLDKLYERLPISSAIRRSKHISPQLDHELDTAHLKLNTEIANRLTPKTHCRPQLLVPGCNNY
jgi:hypothetical protein